MNRRTWRNKSVKVFIITMIALQGLYVIFPLPDIWPFSNYSMFSRARPKTVASSLEIYGLTRDGKEVLLGRGGHFLPLDSSRLKKGIKRVLNHESFIRKQERRVESVFEHLRFLPVDHVKLKESVKLLLPYKGNTAITVEKKEEYLHIIFSYLIDQYEHNRRVKRHGGPPVVALKLYSTEWDWTHTPPKEVLSESKLIYSSKHGLIENE